MLKSLLRPSTLVTFCLAPFGVVNSAPGQEKEAPSPRLEFRIVADQKHDADAIARALKPDGTRATPDGYRWVKVADIIRDDSIPGALFHSEGPEKTRRILVKLDPQNVTEKDLQRVYKTEDSRLGPAIGFVFDQQGALRFGALTRAHLPEDDGATKYALAIILEGVAVSAPFIFTEIRDQGIIEMGNNADAKEVDRIIRFLAEPSRADTERLTVRSVKDQAEAIQRAREIDLPLIAEQADRLVLMPDRGGDVVVLTKQEDVDQFRKALHPRELPPSGGLRAARIVFYRGTLLLREIWIYEGGEWGIVRPGTSWTLGGDPALWELVKTRLKK
jgi:hypothetical protein